MTATIADILTVRAQVRADTLSGTDPSDMDVWEGRSYRHRPGPPINETWWLRHGLITTTPYPGEDPQ